MLERKKSLSQLQVEIEAKQAAIEEMIGSDSSGRKASVQSHGAAAAGVSNGRRRGTRKRTTLSPDVSSGCHLPPVPEHPESERAAEEAGSAESGAPVSSAAPSLSPTPSKQTPGGDARSTAALHPEPEEDPSSKPLPAADDAGARALCICEISPGSPAASAQLFAPAPLFPAAGASISETSDGDGGSDGNDDSVSDGAAREESNKVAAAVGSRSATFDGEMLQTAVLTGLWDTALGVDVARTGAPVVVFKKQVSAWCFFAHVNNSCFCCSSQPNPTACSQSRGRTGAPLLSTSASGKVVQVEGAKREPLDRRLAQAIVKGVMHGVRQDIHEVKR